MATRGVRLVGDEDGQGAIGDFFAVPGRGVGGLAGGYRFAERLRGVLQVAFDDERPQRRPALVVVGRGVEGVDRLLREEAGVPLEDGDDGEVFLEAGAVQVVLAHKVAGERLRLGVQAVEQRSGWQGLPPS